MTQRCTGRLGAALALVLGLWAGAPAPGPAQAPEPVATTGTFVPVAAPGGLQTRTELHWTVEGAGPGSPMSGTALVGPDGTIALGPYGVFQVAGLTVEQARERIERQLSACVRGVRVRLATAELAVATEWRPAGQAPRPLTRVGGPDLMLPESKPAPAPQLQPVPPLQLPARGQPAPPSQFAQQTASPQAAPTAGPGVRSAWRPIQREGATASPAPAPPGGIVHQVAAPRQQPAGKPEVQPTGTNGGPEVPPPPQPVAGAPGSDPALNGGVVVSPPHDSVVMGPGDGPHGTAPPGHPHAPTEGRQVILPPYIIGPPDVLQIDSLQKRLTQPVSGPHLVRPDGTVSLGSYGPVLVAGLTIEQARLEVARTIFQHLNPSPPPGSALPLTLKDVIDGISMDVIAYNSKVYYVITDRTGLGEIVTRLPITGSETVLDAISQIQGLPPEASKRRIWVARKTPGHSGGENKLEVDWRGITQRGEMRTNYQLLPGDRVYVKAEAVQRADYFLAKVLSPIQRLLGITLLGSETVNSIKGTRQ